MRNMEVNTLACIAVLAMAFSLASASDPSPLQDFCVAVNDTNVVGIIIMSSLYSSCPFEIHSLTYTLIFPRLR